MTDAQIEYWSGPGAQRWVTHQTALDRALSSFGAAALRLAAARAGERVLDVGCGCGDSALALAQQVAPDGKVTGVDVAGAMLERARERARSSALNEFVLADAASFAPEPPARFDLVFSRFGVMFFTRPELAFVHLRGLLRAGGRMAFVCWRTLADNPWAQLPFETVQRALPELPPFASEPGPGPFSLADRDSLARLLEDAGFSAIAIDRFDAEVVMSSGDLAEAVQFAIQGGPAARLLRGAPEGALERVSQALSQALAPYRSPRGVALPGSAWLVSAGAP